LIFGLESVDQVDAYVDAELGILLRSERLFRGQVVGRSEVTGLSLDPPAHSHLDDDLSEGETAGESAETGADESAFSGPGWERLKATANAGAAAMGFAIRHAPHREAPAGSRPGSPPDYPATSRDTGWPGPPGPDEPVSAQIIALLYDAGLSHTAFDAELRTWADAATAAAAFRHMTRNANLSGVNRLADAMTQRATTWQGRDTVRIGLPGRYRIDYVDGGKANRKSSTEACDGEQRWRVFPGHVTVGVALPLPSAIARMVDPAWLLEWRLTGGAHVVEGGRAGFLIRVSRRSLSAAATSTPSTPAEAVVDAELGILLRLSQEQGGRPSMQQSFSDLTVRPQSEPGDYRVAIPAGTRVVKDSGTVLDEVELSAPVQTAVQLAVKGLGTAARVGGFLGQRADALHVHRYRVARNKRANSGRSSGQQHVAGQHRHHRGDVADEADDVVHEQRRPGLLLDLAVHGRDQLDVAGVQARLDPRAQRAERVETLGPRPLAVAGLQVPRGHVVRAGISEDHLGNAVRRYIAAQPAEHNG
jgi:hypothetical protein